LTEEIKSPEPTGEGEGNGVIETTGRGANLFPIIGFAIASGKCNKVINKDETRR
jgi:hypothetical protein